MIRDIKDWHLLRIGFKYSHRTQKSNCGGDRYDDQFNCGNTFSINIYVKIYICIYIDNTYNVPIKYIHFNLSITTQ